jgi:hypothetical protein
MDGLHETARWKRCVPRFSPISVLIAQWFYLHALQLIEGVGLMFTPKARYETDLISYRLSRLKMTVASSSGSTGLATCV